MKLGEIGENHKISLNDARKMLYVPVNWHWNLNTIDKILVAKG